MRAGERLGASKLFSVHPPRTGRDSGAAARASPGRRRSRRISQRCSSAPTRPSKLRKAVRLPFLDFSTLAERRSHGEARVRTERAACARDVSRRGAGDARRRWCAGAGGTRAKRWTGWCAWRACPRATFSMRSPNVAGSRRSCWTRSAMRSPPISIRRRRWRWTDGALMQRDLPAGNAARRWRCRLAATQVERWTGSGAGSAELAAPRRLARRARPPATCGARHGDLHLGNLCLWQGRPVPFDALEFRRGRWRSIDVAYDFAFLLMDLEAPRRPRGRQPAC